MKKKKKWKTLLQFLLIKVFAIIIYVMIQTRRVADAAMANDGKFFTLVELHQYLQNSMELYKEKVCLTKFQRMIMQKKSSLLIEPFSFVSQFYLANKDDVNVEGELTIRLHFSRYWVE